MIELIYNEEEASVKEGVQLPEPKNVKQIGAPRLYKKIYMEDFVHLYLLQYSKETQSQNRFAILLGNSLRAGGKRHIYIKSALPIEVLGEKQGKYLFTEKVWGNIYEECEKYFPEQEILGWFLARPGFEVEKTPVIEETHCTYFSGAEKVLFMLEPLEGESAFFGFDGNRFAKQSGYYIYYDRNDPMREFMMSKNEYRKKINEKPDVVIGNYRKILQEKQRKNGNRKKKVISYGARAVAVMGIFAGIFALKEQAEKIMWMEPKISELQTEEMEALSDEVIVEELPGNVTLEELPIAEESIQVEELVEEETIKEELPEKSEELNEVLVETVHDAPTYEEYIVQAGDTLVGISRKAYGTDEKVAEICQLNEIENGDYIQVGEIILLP